MTRVLSQFLQNAADELDFDELSIKALSHRGFDVRGELLLAPSGYPVARADLLSSKDRSRATLTKTYASAFTRWLAGAAAPFATAETALSGLTPFERNALSEGSSIDGGFAVPADVYGQLLSRASTLSTVRQRATVTPVTSDSLSAPALAPNTASGSVYAGDWVAAWVSEIGTPAATDPQFELFEVAVKKLRTPPLRISRTLANDAPSLLTWLVDVGGRDLAAAEDAGFINGDGTPNQPLGILNSGATTVDVEGSTANTISNTVANAGSAPKLEDLIDALPEQYHASAVAVFNRTVDGKIRKLVDASGRFLFPRPRFDSYPVSLNAAMPSDTADGNKCVLFGDLSAYIIAQRSLVVRALRERYADSDQLGLLLIERVGGGLYNPDAVRLGVV